MTPAKDMLSDPSHCSAIRNAYERYGDQYRGVHPPQVYSLFAFNSIDADDQSSIIIEC
jgi:hypothetical protein